MILCSTLYFFPVSQSAFSGYICDKSISVSYDGHKSSVDWKKNGMQLLFEENKYKHYSKTLIQISTGSINYSRFPNKFKPFSKVYHLHNSSPLKTSVTIRIKHDEPNNVQNLCFITCTCDKPPYDFTYLPGGTFTSTYGEIVVSKFSFYIIGQLYFRYRIRGILSLLEKTYEASLYCSARPHIMLSEHCWNIYVSLVKNCRIFSQSVKTYITEDYNDNVQLLTSVHIPRFNHTDTKATISGEISTPDAFLDEPNCTDLHKIEVDNYVDACPPLHKYRLRVKPNSSVTFKFILKGLQGNNQFTFSHHDLPGNKCTAI